MPKRTHYVFAAALWCLLGVIAYASAQDSPFTTLAGPLPKIVEAAKGPYLVISDIEVPAGKLVTIEPGTVLLFRNFTGLHVQGRLVAEGIGTKPVVFTSEFDRDYNPSSSMYPNPYDWNGVYIHANAVGTSMAHFRLFYSVYGIISETKYMRALSGTFANNGKTNLVIEGKEHIIASGPYTYELSLKDAAIDGVPIRILKDPAAPKRNAFRFGGAGAFIGGAAVGVLYTLKWHDAWEKHIALSSKEESNLIGGSDGKWQATASDVNENVAVFVSGYGIGILGAIGFGWSFSF